MNNKFNSMEENGEFSSMPYIATVVTIGFGEFLTAGVGGIILASVFERVSKKHSSWQCSLNRVEL